MGQEFLTWMSPAAQQCKRFQKLLVKRVSNKSDKLHPGNEVSSSQFAGLYLRAESLCLQLLYFQESVLEKFSSLEHPKGTLGLVSDSGWINSTIFIKVVEHVVSTTEANKEDPIDLVLDNHESHLSLDVLECAESHRVHILTLPPHTSHKTAIRQVCLWSNHMF